MATLEDDKDINDIDDDEENEGSAETQVAEPADPNEPIEVETDEAKQSKRKEKRQARRNEFEQLRRERDELRARESARQSQPSYQQPPQQQMHPAAQKLRDIDDAEARLFKQYEIVASRPGYDRNGPEEAEYQRQARAIQAARIATISQASAPQVNEQELMRKIAWQQFTSEHSDVHGADGSNPAWRWALAKYYQLIAEGKADTKQMAEEILDQARVRFGMKPRKGGSAPTQADRQRFSGVSSRAGAASGGSNGNVTMGPNEKRMARIMCEGKKVNGKEMTEPQMYQYWANTVGKKLQAEKSKGG